MPEDDRDIQARLSAEPVPDMDDPGFDSAPARYTVHGREVVDVMRDRCRDMGRIVGVDGDVLFYAACMTHAVKYQLRKKNPKADDQKAQWWQMMAHHVSAPEMCKDPRADRPGFVPYVEHVGCEE